ncbi:hypothetical protein [Flavobacterium sp.]|jgi:hypothetical protein|uniref:hypothetical protein n=1 Tax=Flavobacterium sp. TaxID=239 RepID=UPI0037C17342
MKTKNKLLLLMIFFICAFSNAQETKSNETNSLKTNSTEIRYYYFPNIQAYFDLNEKVYLFKDQGEWIEAEELPKNYGGYSLYNKVKVSITDYDGDEPYLMLELHKKMYPYNSKGRFPNQTASTD